MKKASHGLTLALAAVLALGSQVLVPKALYAVGQSAQTDNNIKAELQNKLKKYKDVQISVKNGIVDLEGTVKDFATKEEVDKTVHRVKNVVAVRNKLMVAGAGEVSDAQLQQAIVKKLQYDRVGYGNAFNAISANVQMSRRNGAAIEHQSRNIEPRQRHDRAGHVLVAAGNGDQAIEEISPRHQLD